MKVAAAAPHAGERSRLRRLTGRAVHEFKQLAVVFLYLYVCYAIFNLHERVVLAQHEISISIFGLAVINAFVLAKVMLVAEQLHFARRFQDRPLALPILYRCVAFALLFIAFHFVEDIVIGLVSGRTLAASIPSIGGGGIGGIAAVGAMMSVMLIPYFAYREIGRVVGEDVLNGALFRRRLRAPGGAQPAVRSGVAADGDRP